MAFYFAAEQVAPAWLPLIHDRMTQAILPDVEAAACLFEHPAPRPMTQVDILGGGQGQP